MPRKSANSLEEQRTQIRQVYKHGVKARRVLVSWESLSDEEKGAKKEAACFLKAAGYSHIYIGEAIGVTRGTVKSWFADNLAMHQRVLDIQADYIDGAVKLLKTYAIELIEMLVEIARSDVDANVRIKAITEALDRMGMSKVNKSESEVTKKSEVDIVDRTGLVAAMAEAPPEIQQEMAQKLEDALALASEHTGRNTNDA